MAVRKRLAYRDVLLEHVTVLERHVARHGVRGMKRLYDQLQDELQERIAKAARKHYSHALISAQLKQGQRLIGHRLARRLGDVSTDTLRVAIGGMARSIAQLSRQAPGGGAVLAVDQAARFAGQIDSRRASLLAMHESSMATYGDRLIRKMQHRLSMGVGLVDSPDQIADSIRETADVEWWQAERIVRTELSWAANAGAIDAMSDTAQVMPGLLARWTEHIDDSGRALDNRVAFDSIAMHGQVTFPGIGMFEMPADDRVPVKRWGMKWPFPPNRPNDRAVALPWRREWGIEGWRLIGGERVELR